MADETLRAILDYILNTAGARELEVITEALKRRQKDMSRLGSIGTDPGRIAKMMASQMESQLKGTREMLERSIRNMAVDIIRKEAPELTDDQISILLNEWIPDQQQRSQRDQQAMEAHSDLPGDVLKSMVFQFIRYSTGKMSAGEQVRMQEEIKDWPEHYWRRFPMRLQKLIRLFLDGRLEGEAFWAEVDRFAFGEEYE